MKGVKGGFDPELVMIFAGVVAFITVVFGGLLIYAHIESGTIKECVQSGQQWIDNSCVRTR